MYRGPLPEGVHPYRGVPGKAQAFITIILEGSPSPTRILADGTVLPVYVEPLAALISALGGYSGYLTDPLAGQKLPVDITRWKDADPEKTGVVIGYSFAPQHPVLPEHRALFDQWTLTHDTYSSITERVKIQEFDGSQRFKSSW
jgi:hypothetical protein